MPLPLPISVPATARHFDTQHLLQIAMPMGGIGAGCISLTGNGSLADWAIRNRPATSALADGWDMRDAGFALLHVRGDKPVTKLLEGPIPPEKLYDQGLQAQGFRRGNYEGLPRFEKATFDASYPTGRVNLTHPDVPLGVAITGFSPFVPNDETASGLPCAILEYSFENKGDRSVTFDFSYHLSNLAVGHRGYKGTRNQRMDGFGVAFTNDDPANYETFGSAAFGIVGQQPAIKTMWLRGGWFDYISALWREVSTGRFTANDGKDGDLDGVNGASLCVTHTVAPGESATLPVVITWYFPNVHYATGGIDDPIFYHRPPAYGVPTDAPPRWRPWYAGQWADGKAVANYVRDHYAALRGRTIAFRDALFSSTVPPEVLDAVSSNLAILKSPTVLRQENGNFWAWEGCFTTHGSCHGSCTHVWNYAQAMPHLFPKLERTLRESELMRSMNEQGHVNFRSALPDGPTKHDFHPAADGQLGGVMKVYRDWQISGDRTWAETMYPLARRSLDFCIATWDPEHRGAVLEPHHNTYDIEFWGANGMTTSCYAGALFALAALADELGHSEDAEPYRALGRRATAYLDHQLFNGTFHQQRVEWTTLRDQSLVAQLNTPLTEHPNPERLALLKTEGPPYQYGGGCLSDGVIGLWFASLYGIPVGHDVDRVRSTLSAIYRHNFKADLADHVCTQRPGYAHGHEAGLLLCTWPNGDKPTLPFVYSDEVWTGIEYQVASHMILEGLVDEALTIVRAVRARYDGRVRNPFNEYECGSYYARAMASYALLLSLSGFRYSAVTGTLTLAPRVTQRPFRTFFSTATAYGTITLDEDTMTLDLIEGELTIKSLSRAIDEPEMRLPSPVIVKAGKPQRLKSSIFS